MQSDNLDLIYGNILNFTCDDLIINYIPIDQPSVQWDLKNIDQGIKKDFLVEIDCNKAITTNSIDGKKEIHQYIKKNLDDHIQSSLSILNDKDKNELMRNIFLSVIDEDWRNHLSSMDYLRQGIGLRSYAQKNPKNEYKRESFEMFEEMLAINNFEIIKILCRIKINNPEISDIVKKENNPTDKTTKKSDDPRCLLNNTHDNVPRNKKCPVTDKKFKQCCGRL